jgi:hypothetical protein
VHRFTVDNDYESVLFGSDRFPVLALLYRALNHRKRTRDV